MRAPEFWARRGALSSALLPLSWAWRAGTALRRATVRPRTAPVPILCVGNLVAGGAGKTPVALSLLHRLRSLGREPHALVRGHGGNERGPHRVNAAVDDAARVGDEALLLAAMAPTWVARDRAAGAIEAARHGADVIVMDDGFQYPGLAKDLSLLVVDGAYGFGNGRVMPAGPLRESIEAGLARAGAVVLMGEDEAGIAARVGAKTLLRARIEPVSREITGRPLLAFAGIGRPEKFRRMLERMGCNVAIFRAFPDHHPYTPDDVMRLCEAASAAGAYPVTTEKDWVRLPVEARAMVATVPVQVVWDDPAALDRILSPLLR